MGSPAPTAGAIAHKGFSLIDVFSPCVTFNKVNTYPWFKERVYKLEGEKGYDSTDLMTFAVKQGVIARGPAPC